MAFFFFFMCPLPFPSTYYPLVITIYPLIITIYPLVITIYPLSPPPSYLFPLHPLPLPLSPLPTTSTSFLTTSTSFLTTHYLSPLHPFIITHYPLPSTSFPTPGSIEVVPSQLNKGVMVTHFLRRLLSKRAGRLPVFACVVSDIPPFYSPFLPTCFYASIVCSIYLMI